MAYEYIQLKFDFGNLAALNRLGSSGWRVVSVQPAHKFLSSTLVEEYFALLVRELPAPPVPAQTTPNISKKGTTE